jgi:hypothetical protein
MLAGALDSAAAISERSRRTVSDASSTIAPAAAYRARASGNNTRIPSFSRIDSAESWMRATSSSDSTLSGSKGLRKQR